MIYPFLLFSIFIRTIQATFPSEIYKEKKRKSD